MFSPIEVPLDPQIEKIDVGPEGYLISKTTGRTIILKDDAGKNPVVALHPTQMIAFVGKRTDGRPGMTKAQLQNFLTQSNIYFNYQTPTDPIRTLPHLTILIESSSGGKAVAYAYIADPNRPDDAPTSLNDVAMCQSLAEKLMGRTLEGDETDLDTEGQEIEATSFKIVDFVYHAQPSDASHYTGATQSPPAKIS